MRDTLKVFRLVALTDGESMRAMRGMEATDAIKRIASCAHS